MSSQPGMNSAARVQRRFMSLPLGARFSYEQGSPEWVVISRAGRGVIAEADPASAISQSICCLADTDEECQAMLVWTSAQTP